MLYPNASISTSEDFLGFRSKLSELCDTSDGTCGLIHGGPFYLKVKTLATLTSVVIFRECSLENVTKMEIIQDGWRL